MTYEWLAPLMFGGALVLIFTGYPVAFALGGTALVFAFAGVAVGYFDWNLLLALPDRTFGVMSNYILLAVPFSSSWGRCWRSRAWPRTCSRPSGCCSGRCAAGWRWL